MRPARAKDGHKGSSLTEDPQRHQTELSSVRQQSRAAGTLSGAGGSAAQHGAGWQLLLGLVLCISLFGKFKFRCWYALMYCCASYCLLLIQWGKWCSTQTLTVKELLSINCQIKNLEVSKMPYIVFLLLLHFLYLCYHISWFVTPHVSKDTYFVQHTHQGIHL